jgi:hypothetical protein
MLTIDDLAVPIFRGLLWGTMASLGLQLIALLASRWWGRPAALRAPRDGEIGV